MKNILLTVPPLDREGGGVTNYYNSILQHIPNDKVTTLEVGSAKGVGLFHPITDQIHFYKAVKKMEPSLIHINPSLDFKSFIRDGLFIWQAKLHACRVLVHYRGWSKSFEKIVEKYFFWFFKKSFGRADANIVLASDFKNKLREWGVKSNIHLGTTTVDEDLLKNFEIENKLARIREALQIRILFLARIERTKGVFETVDAIKELLDKNIPVLLTIAGDGSVYQELKNYAKQKGLAEKINFPGYVTGPQKVKILYDHDIYCLPSSLEGLPNSLLEAMAFGMPVITCPVGGIPDFFKDGQMGYLCKVGSSKEIAQSIKNLLSNKEKLLEISLYNHLYATKKFLAPTVAKQLMNIYSEVLSIKH